MTKTRRVSLTGFTPLLGTGGAAVDRGATPAAAAGKRSLSGATTWGKVISRLAALTLIMFASVFATSGPAALAVSGCTGYPTTCVWAGTGTKNVSNRTQYLGQVSGSASTQDRGYIEVWGDGFYKVASNTTYAVWTINTWVRSGTYICARFTYAHQWSIGGRGPTACIGISV